MNAIVTEARAEVRGFSFNAYIKEDQDNEGYIVCHHGAGSSAATFAVFLKELQKLNPKLGILAYDCRHHGYTEPLAETFAMPSKGLITDLDIDTLCDDLAALMELIAPPRSSTEPPPKKPIMLMGHSMGGTVVSKMACVLANESQFDVRGVIVIDAVEGYARDALRSMTTLLNMWPRKFSSIEDAIDWHIYHGAQLRNKESARISVPPLLKPNSTSGEYEWKLDLERTKPNWDSWFTSLDSMFISAPTARLLVLAGVGRLDTDLTRAQMQGKFQVVVVNDAGHYIQEDCPVKVATTVNEFWDRNGKPINIIPKFGQLRS